MLRRSRGSSTRSCAQDVELADEVIAFDDEVDARYFEIEQGIESLLARQTPVAATSASSSRCCTTTCTSSGWPTSA